MTSGSSASLRDASFSEVRSVADLACLWKKELSRSANHQLASDLYLGRSVVDARATANLLGARLAFVSAGLGLTHASAEVPLYDLTVSPGVGSIAPALANLKSTPADWWMELNAGPAIARLVSDQTTKAVLLALPSGYLEMVSGDLQGCAEDCAEKLRIFTSERGRIAVPEHLRRCVMPYDDRLEATAFPGTRADFPQRALRHFIEELHGHRLSLEKGFSAVTSALSGLVAPQIPRRAKLGDEEIAQLLRRNWEDFGGSSTQLLRFLRDEAQVACEQGRFRRIWHGLCQEFAS